MPITSRGHGGINLRGCMGRNSGCTYNRKTTTIRKVCKKSGRERCVKEVNKERKVGER